MCAPLRLERREVGDHLAGGTAAFPCQLCAILYTVLFRAVCPLLFRALNNRNASDGCR